VGERKGCAYRHENLSVNGKWLECAQVGKKDTDGSVVRQSEAEEAFPNPLFKGKSLDHLLSRTKGKGGREEERFIL